MEINEEESSASSSSSDVVVHAWQVACNSNNTTGSQSPSKEQVLVAALTSNDTKTTMATTHKRKAGRKKFRETRHPIFKGVRERNGGKWVCEVREPNKKSRIWLGTFASPDMAARAYDVAALALRGKSAPLNFPDSAWFLPRAKSSSPRDIQLAALQAANSFQPPRPPPPASTCSPTATSSTTSSSLTTPAAASKFPRVKEREKCTSVETAAAAERGASSTTTFMDEEAMFNMPALLDSMFEGMLLTPPSMKQRFSWDDVDRHMDLSLWSD